MDLFIAVYLNDEEKLPCEDRHLLSSPLPAVHRAGFNGQSLVFVRKLSILGVK